MPKSNCLSCGKEIKYNPSQRNGKYCSNQCQQDYQWVTIIKPKILLGEVKRSPTLRRFLIEEVGYTCSRCDNPGEWQGETLSLEVDHIDGNRDNNLPSNLRFLCPNCHSLTPTWRSKNVGKNTRP
jgi:5-methylcytosine-specific restriction endonuclease McrA